MTQTPAILHYKDAILDRLAERGNVAQFVSFDPELRQRHSRVLSYPPNHRFPDPLAAVGAVLAASVDRSVNVRSFDPLVPKAREFIYGIDDAARVLVELRRLAADGLHTIVNETIDIRDGGVSGVLFGDVIEFSPDDTPRAVDKPGTVALSANAGLRLLETVYGFRPELTPEPGLRIEFSLHPLRRGVEAEHIVLWEVEQYDRDIRLDVQPVWPNNFSRLIGDKVFGLLMADAIGLPVPDTTVMNRRVAPFRFGRETGSDERWIRTAPFEPVPGKFTTVRGWIDPFALMAQEDPAGDTISSVISQASVAASYSGVVAHDPSGAVQVDGVAGYGDGYMAGKAAPAPIPAPVRADVEQLAKRAERAFGPVRMEWVHDGATAWTVQLHLGGTVSSEETVFPGSRERYERFDVRAGLEDLRELADRLDGSTTGVILVGDVGIMSHMGDVLRRRRIPSHIERPAG